jgi:hypothetical protein
MRIYVHPGTLEMPSIAKEHMQTLEKLHDEMEYRNRLIRKLYTHFERLEYETTAKPGMIVIDRFLSECELEYESPNIKTFPSEFTTNTNENKLLTYEIVKHILNEEKNKTDEDEKNQRLEFLRSLRLIPPGVYTQENLISISKREAHTEKVINNVFHIDHSNNTVAPRSVMFIAKGYHTAELNYGPVYKMTYAFNDSERKIFIRLEETNRVVKTTPKRVDPATVHNDKVENLREFLLIFNMSYKISSKINPPSFGKNAQSESEHTDPMKAAIIKKTSEPNPVLNKAIQKVITENTKLAQTIKDDDKTMKYLTEKYPISRYVYQQTLSVREMVKHDSCYLRDLVIVIYAFEFLKTIATLLLYVKNKPKDDSDKITGETNDSYKITGERSLWDQIKKSISQEITVTSGKETKNIITQVCKMAKFVGLIFNHYDDKSKAKLIQKICLSETGIKPDEITNQDFGHILLVKILNSSPADENKINIITSSISGLKSAEHMINIKITKNKWWTTWESDCQKYHSTLLFSIKHKYEFDLPSLVEEKLVDEKEGISWLGDHNVYDFRKEMQLRPALAGENPKIQYLPLDFEVKLSIEQIIQGPYACNLGVTVNRNQKDQKRRGFKRLDEVKQKWFENKPAVYQGHRNSYSRRVGRVDMFY